MFRVFNEERCVDAEYRTTVAQQARSTRVVRDFNHFWTTTEINDYITFLASFHGDICATETMGYSVQGQLIRALTISLGRGGHIDGSRPVVFIDAGIHAREWVTQTFAIYIMHQLVENRNANLDILQNLDFIIIPNVNPDGYDYSHSTVR